VPPVAISVLLLSTSVALAAPAPFPRPERRSDNELFKLQGAWEREAAYVWQGGGWTLFHRHPGISAVIRGNRIERFDVVLPGSATQLVTLHRGTPQGIDFTCTLTHCVDRCVYRLDGETLTIIYPRQDEQRPASLDRGYQKVVYRRKR
jgi:hypothetical protein